MNYSFPTPVCRCLNTMRSAGIKAYPVGGCVRDIMLGISPHDFDVTVNAAPEKVKSLFERTADTGIKHGTVTVIIDGMPIEVTQMRIDGEYADNRHPIGVIPTGELGEDLMRRDFTVNALAMDENGEIIDICGGISDLERRIIRAIGEPKRRYGEDALRILRAFRFSSKLDFDIEVKTKEEALRLSPLLKNISVERIRDELVKTVCGRRPSALEPLLKCGALEFVGLEYHYPLNISALPNDRELRFAALLLLCNADSNIVCKNLKTDNKMKRQCRFYTDNIKSGVEFTAENIKRLICESDFESVGWLIILSGAINERDVRNELEMLENISSDPIYLKDLAVGGSDLSALGLSGAHISEMLKYLLGRVHSEPLLNEKTTLINIIKNIEKQR